MSTAPAPTSSTTIEPPQEISAADMLASINELVRSRPEQLLVIVTSNQIFPLERVLRYDSNRFARMLPQPTLLMRSETAQAICAEFPLMMKRRISRTTAEYQMAGPFDATRITTIFPPFAGPDVSPDTT